MDDESDYILAGFLIGVMFLAIVITIFNIITPTKRQAYKVHKENDLTIVERVEE